MTIESIFEVISGCLYAIKFENEAFDEFSKAFEQWVDIEYLFDFFNKHSSDLNKEFYNDVDIEIAIERTVEDAKNLEEEILIIAQSGIKNRYVTL